MAVYAYGKVAVYAEQAGTLRLARSARVFVTDAVTHAPVNVTQGAATRPYIDTDGTGLASFTAEHPGPLRMTAGAVFVDVYSDELPGIALDAVAAAEAAQAAAADAAAAAYGPADATVAALVGSTSATRTALDDRYAQARGLGLNVLEFGAVGDGVHDDTTAIQAALDAAGTEGPFGGGSVYLPVGTYKVSATLTVPQEVTVLGQSYNQTIIKTSSATGHVIVLHSACVVRDLLIQASVTRTAGSHISIEGSQVVVDHCSFMQYSVAISVGTVGTKAALTIISRCVFREPVVGAGFGGIHLVNFASPSISDVVMTGNDAGTQTDFGIRIWAGDTAFVGPNVNVVAHGTGLLIDPIGVSAFAIYVTQAMFDTPGPTTSNGFPSGMDINPGAAGFVYDLTCTNTWFGNSRTAHGAAIVSGSGVVDGVQLTGCEFVGNSYAGVYTNGVDAKNWSVTGGLAAGNGNVAVDAQNSTSRFSITGLRAGPTGVHGPNGVGVRVGASASDYYTITGCNLALNTGSGLSDSGTGAHKVVANNLT
jgi:hypothetical protein